MKLKDIKDNHYWVDLKFPIEIESDWIEEQFMTDMSEDDEFTEEQLKEFILTKCLPNYYDFFDNLEVTIEY